MTSRQPDGWHTLTTRLVATDAERLVQFLRSVFHVTGDFRPDRPAEIRIGDSVLMVSGADERSPFRAFLYIYVDDADAVYRRALANGATSLEDRCRPGRGADRGVLRLGHRHRASRLGGPFFTRSPTPRPIDLLHRPVCVSAPRSVRLML